MDGVDPRDKQKRDFADLQNEIAGRDVPRRSRFMPRSANSIEAKRKEREARAFRDMLEQLLADPIYKAKYDGVMDALRKAERATEAALNQIHDAMAASLTELENMEHRAARTADGSRVFKDSNGVVRYADGSIVDDVDVATVLWTGNEPSFEEYSALHRQLEMQRQQEAEITGYLDNVLGTARDKLTDREDPPDMDGLGEIEDGILGGMPKAVSQHFEAPEPSPSIPAGMSANAVPSTPIKL